MPHTRHAYPTGSAIDLDEDGLQLWACLEWVDGVMPLPLDAVSWIPSGASAGLEGFPDEPVMTYALTEKRA